MISPIKVWRNQKQTRSMLGKTGKIITWTVVRVPPMGFADSAPYPIVVIEFDDGTRLSCQMVDYLPGNLSFGTRVRVVLRRIPVPDREGIIPYGLKVKPL